MNFPGQYTFPDILPPIQNIASNILQQDPPACLDAFQVQIRVYSHDHDEQSYKWRTHMKSLAWDPAGEKPFGVRDRIEGLAGVCLHNPAVYYLHSGLVGIGKIKGQYRASMNGARITRVKYGFDFPPRADGSFLSNALTPQEMEAFEGDQAPWIKQLQWGVGYLVDAQKQLIEKVSLRCGSAGLKPAIACRFQIHRDYQILDDDFDEVFAKLHHALVHVRGAENRTTDYYKHKGIQAEWVVPYSNPNLANTAKTIVACYRRKNSLRIEHRWENLSLGTVAQASLEDLQNGLYFIAQHSQSYLKEVHQLSLRILPKLQISPQALKSILYSRYGVRQFNDRMKELIRQICLTGEYDPVLARVKTNERIKSYDLTHRFAHLIHGILESRHPKKSDGTDETRFLYRLRADWERRANNAPSRFWLD